LRGASEFIHSPEALALTRYSRIGNSLTRQQHTEAARDRAVMLIEGSSAKIVDVSKHEVLAGARIINRTFACACFDLIYKWQRQTIVP